MLAHLLFSLINGEIFSKPFCYLLRWKVDQTTGTGVAAGAIVDHRQPQPIAIFLLAANFLALP